MIGHIEILQLNPNVKTSYGEVIAQTLVIYVKIILIYIFDKKVIINGNHETPHRGQQAKE